MSKCEQDLGVPKAWVTPGRQAGSSECHLPALFLFSLGSEQIAVWKGSKNSRSYQIFQWLLETWQHLLRGEKMGASGSCPPQLYE